MKECIKCKKKLPSTEFYPTRNDCKRCRAKYMKEYRDEKQYNKKYYKRFKEKEKDRTLANYYKFKKDPEKKLKWRENQLKVKYNITIEEWDLMYESQEYKCAICETDEPCGNGLMHVDHCHSTGNIRGLLCHHCNVALGSFKDSIEVLEKAIKYLKKQEK